MSNFPADPYSDKVDAFPCWAAIPRQSMQTVWTELHRTEKSRKDMVDRLKKVDQKAWLAICRERACVGIDLKTWFPLIRMLALESNEEEIKDACPLPERGGDDDAIEMARQVLLEAVRGELEIDDVERVRAANMILRMKSTKISDNVINVTTGVPRDEKPSITNSSNRVFEYEGDCGSGENGESGFGGIEGINRTGEARGGEEDYSSS